ncbi:MAG: molybdopterin oxidoreductase family protein [Chloroflexia bacterium]|nr:molybdopterin oxidoreductase family protein [Chloroflexia bacterium]
MGTTSQDGSATTLVRGACPHDCPDTCATLTEVRVGRAVRFVADPSHPITDGWLCAKVRPYLDRVYHPDRLLYPRRRKGAKGGGRWERIGWDEALGEIATRWRAIIAEHSAAAILPYSYSGTLGLAQLSLCNTRLWNRMGASGLKRSICDAAAEVAIEATIGVRQSPDPRDLLQSKLILIWGHNPASTNPHVMPIIRRAQRAGARVVVIDPRRTLTARSADWHLQPRPATDGALALGLLHVLVAEGLADKAWLEEHSVGWRELRERAAAYPPARVAAITGLDEDEVVALARLYGTTKPGILKFSDGVQRHANGGQTIRALLCLPAVTGQYGTPGGGLYYSQSGWIAWDREAMGHASECPPTPREVNMNRLGAALLGEVTDPPIQSLYVFCANPAAASPNAGLIAEGLQRDDLFTVVHELFETDTARYADILLPATSQLEQTDLHKPYGHHHLQYNQQAIAPLGEATSNWDVMRLLAARMGYDEPWLRHSAEEAIAEVLNATRATNPLLAGITLDRLQREGTVPYSFPPETSIPFADGRFPTPSGKVELRCEAMRAYGVDPLPDYVPPAELTDHPAAEGWLTLLSGAAHHFVTTSLANVPTLRAKEGAPAIELNPVDAAARGIADGALVEVHNARGGCRLVAKVTDAVPAGVAVAPKGHWAKHSDDGRNVNWLTSDALADLGGQSTFHTNAVRVRTVTDEATGNGARRGQDRTVPVT